MVDRARSQLPRRVDPLDGRYHAAGGLTLSPLPPRRRLVLQAFGAEPSQQMMAAASEILGLRLPDRAKTSATGEAWTALWLGPTEWLLLGRDERAATWVHDSQDLPALASVVDVSNRNVGLVVDGPAAEAVIAEGCPQDLRLRSFPVGACSRTVLSKAEIVLWRTDEHRFEIECWRSFADYVWTFLEEASRAPAV